MAFGPASAQQIASPQDKPDIETVVVTAQKRVERIQDVPLSVTAIAADQLLAKNQTQLQDYFNEVPGFTLVPSGSGQNYIALRGLSTGALVNPTVGVTIDDVPYGSTTALGYGNRLLPDLDPGGLSDIEVLRGPQGTLYGANSLGGQLKFQTRDASLEEFSGRAEADINSVDNGGTGFGLHGSIDLPLVTDTLGVIVNAFDRRDAGFIDNPVLGTEDLNHNEVSGVQGSVLWRISDVASLKVGALFQRNVDHGDATEFTNYLFQPILGDLKQGYPLPGIGPSDVTVQLYTAKLSVDVWDGYNITAVSGYGINSYVAPLDWSFVFGSGVKLTDDFETKKFSQEVRLTSPTGHMFEWLLGAFYTNEDTSAEQQLILENPANGDFEATLVDSVFPTTYKEYAFFGDLDVHFTDRFDAQIGGRYSNNSQTYSETDCGALVGCPPGPPFTVPEQHSNDSKFNFLVTARYKITPDTMIYARVASGYRPGGPNPDAILFGAPMTFKPDSIVNYEVGIKGSTFDVLSFEAAAYYIDWSQIQLQQTDPQTQLKYFINGAGAKSEGIELSARWYPAEGLEIAGSASFNNAVLTQNLPAGTAFGLSGDRLPYSAPFSGSLSADKNFDIGGGWTLFAGGTLNYTGARDTPFVSSASDLRLQMPSYVYGNLRMGFEFEDWTGTLYMNNVGNARGVLNTGVLGGSPTKTSEYATLVLRPRLMGFSLAKKF